MKRKIIHLLKENKIFGGTQSTTLCHKSQWQGEESSKGGGNNVTTNPKEVTCKLCLKIMKLAGDKLK